MKKSSPKMRVRVVPKNKVRVVLKKLYTVTMWEQGSNVPVEITKDPPFGHEIDWNKYDVQVDIDLKIEHMCHDAWNHSEISFKLFEYCRDVALSVMDGTVYEDIVLELNPSEDCECPYLFPAIVGVRDETDEEYKKRCADIIAKMEAEEKEKEERRKRREAKRVEAEKKLLADLQNKYGTKLKTERLGYD